MRSSLSILLLLALAACSFALAACREAPPAAEIDRAMYYWKSTLPLRPDESRALDSLKVRKLYVKFFDVAYDVSAMRVRPVAVLRADSSGLPPVEIVPVIFITEDALNRTPNTALRELGANIASTIASLSGKLGVAPKEIQFDCDWSARTRDTYFWLLQDLKQRTGVSLSATIRLHQVKYRSQTGVPPVDRGMLMFYNMSNWRDVGTRNSILDLDETEKYVDYLKDYPLTLDVVFPLFRWTLAFRNERFLTILNGAGQERWGSSAFAPKGKNRFSVIRDTMVGSASLKRGDLLRVEEVSAHDLADASAMVTKRMNSRRFTLAFYHLDSSVLSRYSFDALRSIYQGQTP